MLRQIHPEVRTYGGDEDDEQIFVGGANAHLCAGTDEQRTDVKCCTTLVGRDETLIEFHHAAHHFHKLLGREFGHQNAAASALHAFGIVGESECADFTIGATEGFLSFEGLLSVVQTGGGHVQVDGFGRRHFNFAPFAVAIVATHVVVGGHVAEGQIGPVDIFHAIRS